MRMGVLVVAAQLSLAAMGGMLGCQSEAIIDLHPSDTDAADAAIETGGQATGGQGAMGGQRATGGATDPDAADSGMPDAGTVDAGPPSESLLLRYDFEGDGTVVTDRAGNHDGEIAGGGALSGAGQLVMDGVDDHVTMPAGLFEGRSELTFMAWVTWTGNRCWERILEVGYRDQSTDWMPPTSSLFVTALSCGHESVAAFVEVDRNMYSVRQGWPLPLDTQSHVVVSVADEGPTGTLYLYVDGTQVGVGPMPYPLSELTDEMAFLGRSLWSHDPYFQGTFEEFRIYVRALSDSEVMAAYEAGPDAL